jgi:hypothetical protein
MQVVSHDVTWLLSHIRVISSELPESAGATPTPAVHVGALTRAVSRSVFVTVTVRTPRCRQLTPIGSVRPLVGMEESRKESRRIGRDCIQMRAAAKLVRDSGWMNDTPWFVVGRRIAERLWARRNLTSQERANLLACYTPPALITASLGGHVR